MENENKLLNLPLEISSKVLEYCSIEDVLNLEIIYPELEACSYVLYKKFKETKSKLYEILKEKAANKLRVLIYKYYMSKIYDSSEFFSSDELKWKYHDLYYKVKEIEENQVQNLRKKYYSLYDFPFEKLQKKFDDSQCYCTKECSVDYYEYYFPYFHYDTFPWPSLLNSDVESPMCQSLQRKTKKPRKVYTIIVNASDSYGKEDLVVEIGNFYEYKYK